MSKGLTKTTVVLPWPHYSYEHNPAPCTVVLALEPPHKTMSAVSRPAKNNTGLPQAKLTAW